MKKRIRLKEIAEELGISRTAVSRALNNYPDIGKETRDRVFATAERLGYVPDMLARKLAVGRSDAIGYIFSQEKDAFISPNLVEWIVGATSWCSKHGILLSLGASIDDRDLSVYQTLVQSRQVDGLFIGSPRWDDVRISFLTERKFPFIVHGRTSSDFPYAWLDIDNEGAFYQATKLLLDLGHCRIALINAEQGLTFAMHRENGFRRAHAERGIAPQESMMQSSTMTEENGYLDSLRCLDGEIKPTAFLCSSVTTALGCLRALRDHNLRVPEDCSLIAHDDVLPSISAEKMIPSLTTTRSSLRKAGERAAELLLEIVNGRPIEDVHELWQADLILRASTAPPPRI